LRDNERELLWQTAIVVWLGMGGPSFRAFRHIRDGAELCGKMCPVSARLPPLDSRRSLKCMYDHLDSLQRQHGRPQVLAGDGTAVKFRFSKSQGLPLLEDWRRHVRDLADYAEARGGIANLGPRDVDARLRPAKCFKDLALKEYLLYLNAAYANIDPNVHVPCGPGARKGAKLVLGARRAELGDLHGQLRALTERIPFSLSGKIREAIRRKRLASPLRRKGHKRKACKPKTWKPNAGDVEVCMCWYQAYVKAKARGWKKPTSWRAFRREAWPHLTNFGQNQATMAH